jgi:hypothetical protein
VVLGNMDAKEAAGQFIEDAQSIVERAL